jgi:hypothetical protein
MRREEVWDKYSSSPPSPPPGTMGWIMLLAGGEGEGEGGDRWGGNIFN